jgi:bacterioferritin-associated ferredoxin
MGKTAKWRKFTRQEIEQFVQESCSYAALAEKLGYNSRAGSCVKSIRAMINELHLDVSHFTGQGWKYNNFDYGRFRKGVVIRSSQALDALIFIRGHCCERCGESQWLGQPIPLEVHHEDGDSLNNEMDNLKLLCPNCHALTDNYRGRNINTGVKQISDDSFANALNDSPNIRQALKKLGLSAKGDNYRRARDIIFKYNITHLMQEHQEEKSPE